MILDLNGIERKSFVNVKISKIEENLNYSNNLNSSKRKTLRRIKLERTTQKIRVVQN